MKAAVCRTHGAPLTIEDVSVIPPGPGQVRVDIRACAICHSDITYAAGGWGGATPAIYGHEAAGVVESTGSDVDQVAPGDRVVVGLLRSCGCCYHCLRGEEHLCIGDFDEAPPFSASDGTPIVQGLRTGAFARQTVVHHSQLALLPDDIPFEAGCLLACGVVTGFGAVTNTARMPTGSTAAVIGAGGVGLSAMQGAAYAGASRLIAVDLVDAKLDTARHFGATDTINVARDDAVAAVREATDGTGADYVFVTVGAAAAVAQGIGMARRGGMVVVVGMPPSGVTAELEVADFADASLTIVGSKMGSARMSVDVPRLIDLSRSGDLRLSEMVSHVFPVERINEAIAEVITGGVIRNVISFAELGED